MIIQEAHNNLSGIGTINTNGNRNDKIRTRPMPEYGQTLNLDTLYDKLSQSDTKKTSHSQGTTAPPASPPDTPVTLANQGQNSGTPGTVADSPKEVFAKIYTHLITKIPPKTSS